MGILDPDTGMTNLKPTTRYSSWKRVVSAFRQGFLTYNQAIDILMSQFGFSQTDAQELLQEGITPPKPPQPPEDPTPDLPGEGEESEVIPDTSTDTSDSSEGFEPLTEDQRYMLIGLAVLGAFLGFFK